jgi:hypothetical protein
MILVCPPGASDAPISHGAEAYPPYRAYTDRDHPLNGMWLVDVPPEVGQHLMHNGGFYQWKP